MFQNTFKNICCVTIMTVKWYCVTIFDSHRRLRSSAANILHHVLPTTAYFPSKVLPKNISEKLDGSTVFRLVLVALGSPKMCGIDMSVMSWRIWIEAVFFLNFNLMTSQKVILPYSPLSNESEKKTNIKTLSDGQHVFPQLTDNEPSGPWLERKTHLFFCHQLRLQAETKQQTITMQCFSSVLRFCSDQICHHSVCRDVNSQRLNLCFFCLEHDDVFIFQKEQSICAKI